VSRVVVDTSVFAELDFAEDYGEQTIALFDDVERAGWRIFTSLNLPVEFSNVCRRRMRREGLTLPDALHALGLLLALPVTLVGGGETNRDALRLTEQFSLSTYDAQFVPLARALDCDLWIADYAGQVGA
jgi:predicted nucleic acid-binding protein